MICPLLSFGFYNSQNMGQFSILIIHVKCEINTYFMYSMTFLCFCRFVRIYFSGRHTMGTVFSSLNTVEIIISTLSGYSPFVGDI